MKNRWVYISVFLLLLAMIFLYPREGKFEYEYQKGSPWVYPTLITSFDFPILKTEQELHNEMEQRSNRIVDYYNLEPSIASKKVSQFTHSAISAGVPPILVDTIARRIAQEYSSGILPDFEDEQIADKVVIIKRDKRMQEIPMQELSTVSMVYDDICASMRSSFPRETCDSIIDRLNIRSFISPNLFFDDYTTKLVHRESVNNISPTKGMVYSGQLIVSNGEIITPDIFQTLESYKAEYINNFGFTGSRFALWTSHILTVIVLVLILCLCISFVFRPSDIDVRNVVFMLLLELIVFFVTVQIYKTHREFLPLIPYAVIAMYIYAFFNKTTTAILFPAILLPALVIPERGLQLYLINLTGGLLILFTQRRFYRGWHQFINAAIAFLGMSVVMISFELSAGMNFSQIIKSYFLYAMAINAVGTIILYPFVYLFEKIFGFVSYSKLKDLSDTDNKLLQKLQHTVPGTFQHSLQVANLAENAAKQIGANVLLVRVGALYHDVGKIENPMCFIENAAGGVNYHSELSPKESAMAIIKHVDDGMEMARKASLPTLVSDFIQTHHGTTCVEYFYNVHCNNGGDPNEVSDFTYHGVKPQTKEHAILMLADAVEAAARTIKDYNEETVSSLVNGIFEKKNKENQFAEADISNKELNAVVESFKIYLQHIYHTRISYPSRDR